MGRRGRMSWGLAGVLLAALLLPGGFLLLADAYGDAFQTTGGSHEALPR